MGNTCKPMAVSFQCMTKSTTIKKKRKWKKKPVYSQRSGCKGTPLWQKTCRNCYNDLKSSVLVSLGGGTGWYSLLMNAQALGDSSQVETGIQGYGQGLLCPQAQSGLSRLCMSGDTDWKVGLKQVNPGVGNGNPLQYFAWEIPWTEEPGGLQSMEWQKRHDLAIKWQ